MKGHEAVDGRGRKTEEIQLIYGEFLAEIGNIEEAKKIFTTICNNSAKTTINPNAIFSLAQLQSGKEALVFIVRFEGKLCVAKVYKKANNRSFKNRADYTEGRKVRNSRQQRAMSKKSSFGREALEASWYQSEYQMLSRLQNTELLIPDIGRSPFDRNAYMEPMFESRSAKSLALRTTLRET